jgi:hypothetical protein
MPLPMVHLAVAMRLCSSRGIAPSPAFLLGSLAPDAIHMRDSVLSEDKHYVHLRKARDQEDLRRIHDLLKSHRSQSPDMKDFAEGYVVHILTDLVWASTVYEVFCSSLPEGIAPQAQRILYYQETDQVDFNLYATVPWRSEVWELLDTARPVDFDSLLTAEEIRGWQQRVLRWFDEIKEEPRIQPKYITEEIVLHFIDDAVRIILEWFRESSH